jgi:hypothetical protein
MIVLRSYLRDVSICKDFVRTPLGEHQWAQSLTLEQVTATADAITGKEHLAWQELLDSPGLDAGAQASDDKRPPR